MKTTDLEAGHDYVAYVGSRSIVRVLEVGVEYQYATGGKTLGARVEALTDVPLALDWQAAQAQGRPQRLAHRKGERFTIPTKDIVGPAEAPTNRSGYRYR